VPKDRTPMHFVVYLEYGEFKRFFFRGPLSGPSLELLSWKPARNHCSKRVGLVSMGTTTTDCYRVTKVISKWYVQAENQRHLVTSFKNLWTWHSTSRNGHTIFCDCHIILCL